MKRLLILSTLTVMSFSLMGCQLFQQQEQQEADGASETSTATVNISDGQTATSTGTLTISEPDTMTSTGTLEITENGAE